MLAYAHFPLDDQIALCGCQLLVLAGIVQVLRKKLAASRSWFGLCRRWASPSALIERGRHRLPVLIREVRRPRVYVTFLALIAAAMIVVAYGLMTHADRSPQKPPQETLVHLSWVGEGPGREVGRSVVALKPVADDAELSGAERFLSRRYVTGFALLSGFLVILVFLFAHGSRASS